MTYDRELSGEYTHYFLFLGLRGSFFISGNSKTVLNSASKATTAENALPCLLLKPLITPVLPCVSSSVISASESVLPALMRNTGSPHAALSQRTTLP